MMKKVSVPVWAAFVAAFIVLVIALIVVNEFNDNKEEALLREYGLTAELIDLIPFRKWVLEEEEARLVLQTDSLLKGWYADTAGATSDYLYEKFRSSEEELTLCRTEIFNLDKFYFSLVLRKEDMDLLME